MSVQTSEQNESMMGGDFNLSDGLNTNKEKVVIGLIAGGLTYFWMRKRLKTAYGKAIQKGMKIKRRYSNYRRRYSRR